MENFNAILQGLGAGRVSGAVAKTAWCHPSIAITDPSQGSNSSSSGMCHHCLAMGRPSGALGDTMGSRTMSLLSSFCVHRPWQRDSHVPRGTPATQHWHIQAMSALTGTEKLKSFLPHEKVPDSFPQNDREVKHIQNSARSAALVPQLPLVSHSFSVKWM